MNDRGLLRPERIQKEEHKMELNKNIDIDAFGQMFSLSRPQVLEMVEQVGFAENGNPVYQLGPINAEKFVTSCLANC